MAIHRRARPLHTCARLAAAALFTIASAAHAGVLSSDDVLAQTGQSIDQWGASWWQWSFGNPDVLSDTTGASGPLGDVGGPVFFAEGSSGGSLTLTYSVPSDQFILLPVATYLWTFFDPCADATCAANIVNTYADGINQLYATIDGTPVADLTSHLVRVDPLSPLVFQVDAGPVGSDGYGGILDAVESGYWLMLDPLSAGTHDISFGASVPLTDADTGMPLGGSIDQSTELVVTSVPEPPIAVLLAGCGFFLAMSARRRNAVKNQGLVKSP